MSVWTTAGLIADGSFDDPENARIIYIAAGGLVLVAALLGVGTWLWWRSAKVEHPSLAPLEVMSTRRWWKGDFTERRRRLDEVRPQSDDADAAEVAVAVPVDLDQVMLRDDPHSFDDLLDPAAVAAVVVADDAVAADDDADDADVGVAADGGEAADDVVADDSVGDAEAVAEADEPVAEAEPMAVEGESVAEAESDTEDESIAVEGADEPVVAAAESVAVDDEPIAVGDDAASGADAEPQPQLHFEPVAAAPRSIVIDTAPRPRDTPSDLGPESIDSEPTPSPIDPLLRLQTE